MPDSTYDHVNPVLLRYVASPDKLTMGPNRSRTIAAGKSVKGFEGMTDVIAKIGDHSSALAGGVLKQMGLVSNIQMVEPGASITHATQFAMKFRGNN